MKLSKKLLATVLATSVVATSILAGCAKKDEPKDTADSSKKTELTMTTWSYDNTPEFKALIEAFQKSNPNITIKYTDIASADYDTKLTTMLASGDTTDILPMKNVSSYAAYAKRGQLLDLTEAVGKVDKKNYNDVYDMIKTENGKYYAMPYRYDFNVLYYNKKVLADAGVSDISNLTWDQYVALAKKLTKGTDPNKVYGAYVHTWDAITLSTASAQTGSDILGGKYDYAKPYYERLLKMQSDGSIMQYGTIKSTKTTYQSQFETEKCATMIMGTWYMGAIISAKNKGNTNVDWSIAPMPQQTADGKITTYGSPTPFAINKNSKNKEAAQKFLEFASGEQGAKVLAGIGIVPAYRDDAVNKIFLSAAGMPTDETAKKAFTPDKIGLQLPANSKSAAVDKILQEEHDLIMVGSNSIDKGIESMNKRVTAELAK